MDTSDNLFVAEAMEVKVKKFQYYKWAKKKKKELSVNIA